MSMFNLIEKYLYKNRLKMFFLSKRGTGRPIEDIVINTFKYANNTSKKDKEIEKKGGER